MNLVSTVLQQVALDWIPFEIVLSVLLGAASTLGVQQYLRWKEIHRKTNVLRRSLLTELKSMNYLDRQLEATSEVSEPAKVVKLRPGFRDRPLFSRTIFEVNAGSLGLLSKKERSLVIDTYTSAEQIDAHLSTPDPTSDPGDDGDGLWRPATDVAETLGNLREKRDRTIEALEEELPTDDQEAVPYADD